ncbi:MAG TPA: APC family permease [Terriglobales bacterium]|nr:APC family permease [Terriglobales bacterium]
MNRVQQLGQRKGMGLWALVAATYFMASGGPYGLEEIVQGAGYGGAIFLLLLTPVIWTLPTTMMVAELSSAIPAEGGYYVWVRRAMGPFWGFQEAWLSMASSIFDLAIYPTLFLAYLSRLVPGMDQGWHGMAIGAALIAGCVVWNFGGGKVVGDSSLITLILMLGPFAVLTVLALLPVHNLQMPTTTATHTGLVTGLLVCMWNYMGYDNASNVGGEVENPQRTYPLAMFVCVGLTALGYVLPVAAMAHTGIGAGAWTTGSWATLGGILGGRWLEIAIVLGGMIAALSTFNTLLMSYSRLPLAMAEDGLLPRVFQRVQQKTGAPWVAIVACAILYGACLGLGFDRLITLDVLLWGASLFLEFLALLVLRIREPQMRRPFRVPGGFWGAALLGVAPMVLLVAAGLHSGDEGIAGMSVWAFGGLVTLAGFAAYAIARRFGKTVEATVVASSRS